MIRKETRSDLSGMIEKNFGPHVVSQVFPPDDLMRHATGIARRIASKGQLAVRAALKALQQGLEPGFREGLLLEATVFGALCESEDKQEGLAAFLEKRSPHFKNR